MKELVTLARQQSGVLNYGSAGAGGVNHLMLELLKERTGTFITHIPYRGVAPSTMNIINGPIQLITGTTPALPDVPCMIEAGLAGKSALNTALNEVMALPELVVRFRADAVEAASSSPALLGPLIAAVCRARRNLVKTQNLIVE